MIIIFRMVNLKKCQIIMTQYGLTEEIQTNAKLHTES